MIILFLLFLIQFSIACSCLAVNSEQQRGFAENGWSISSNETKDKVQNEFLCCGFNSSSTSDHPSCDIVDQICCPVKASCVHCDPCMPKLEDTINYAFRLCGGIGLFFSFSEVSHSKLAPIEFMLTNNNN